MANATEHPPERTKDAAGRAIPQLPCPKCSATPGREFDTDGGGGYFTDCRFCHGTGKVPDMAALAKTHEAEAAAAAAAPASG